MSMLGEEPLCYQDHNNNDRKVVNVIWKMNPIMISSSQADQDFLGLVDSGADTSMNGPNSLLKFNMTIEGSVLRVLEAHPILSAT